MLPQIDVVGLGLNAMDTICTVDRLPQANTKIPIRSIRVEPGGQVATALATCTRFGLTTRYLGAVGDDAAGKAQLQSLIDCGLSTEHVRVVEGATTQCAIILLESGVGERTILWHHDPRLSIPVESLQRELITTARILLVDGCDAPAALQSARWARDAGIPVVIDIDELYDESTHDLLSTTDYLIAADDFAKGLFGDLSPEDSARALFERYRCKVVGVTLGVNGAVFLENGRTIHSPGFRVDVADTTGAGDVFHAAFIYGLLQNWDLETTARFANAAAAVKCTRVGARRGIPSLEEVRRII